MKKIVFVCNANRHRSPTAEQVFREMAQEKDIEVNVTSAGIDADEDRTNLSWFLIKNSDKIFVMEKYMKDIIVDKYEVEPKKIISLDIPDIYHRNDPGLIEILKSKLEPYLLNFKENVNYIKGR